MLKRMVIPRDVTEEEEEVSEDTDDTDSVKSYPDNVKSYSPALIIDESTPEPLSPTLYTSIADGKDKGQTTVVRSWSRCIFQGI